MIRLLPVLLFGVVLCSPLLEVRTVSSLDQASFEEAQQRDKTATRAFSSTAIKTSDGKCLFVNELSGDFRANLTPVQVAACDGSAGQKWDIITAGEHDDQAGTMLVVSTLTQACLNFDPRRAAGNTVILFSCGGRADGGGQVTNSQLFTFTGGAGPLSLEPLNQAGTCLAVTSRNVLDQAACSPGTASQTFTFGGGSSSAAKASNTASKSATATTEKAATTTFPSSASKAAAATSSEDAPPAVSSKDDPAACGVTLVTVTRGASSSDSAAATTSASPQAIETTSSSSLEASTTAAPIPEADSNPTTAVPVSRAGGVLQPSSAAEANPRDNTATRPFSSVSIIDSTGLCLTIDPTAGDFRQNLIPVQLSICGSSAGQKFDFITAGAHNDALNSTLVVSSLTQGCLNFDARRVAGDTVILFSCGGRADGGGQTTNSQLFPFAAGEKSLTLAPENQDGATCLIPLNGKLDEADCAAGDKGQVFTIGL